ncbi:MAG: GNAT family N-acetyltransferase [Clostridiaceae bacterium]|nr:GNAT family N-acetyltransferase [Clostridiaceae bacterium]
MRIDELCPSQFYISEEKLAEVRRWLNPSDLGSFAPLPIKWLDGSPVLTDGHTRACAAAMAGIAEVPTCIESNELDWKAYRRCVAACRERGINAVPDLMRRVVSAEEYRRLWEDWCDWLHTELAADSPASGLVLETPGPVREKEAAEYIAEFRRYGSQIHGAGGLDRYDGDYGGWLQRCALYAEERTVPEGRVPGPTFFCVRESDGKIVGMVNIRLRLNAEMLQTGGHIGYSVRPTERCKGYASELLRLALSYLRAQGVSRALVTCDTVNQASARVIQKNGGVLENEVLEEDGTPVQRYWIEG